MKQSSLNSTQEANNSESNSDELVQRIPIEDTPFTAIKFDDKWFLTMGKYRLTDPVDTLEGVKEDAQRADWARVMQIMQIMIDENENKKATAQLNAAIENKSIQLKQN